MTKKRQTQKTEPRDLKQSARERALPTHIEEEAAGLWELLNDTGASEQDGHHIPQAVRNFVEKFVIELSNETGIEYCSHVDIRVMLPLMIEQVGAEEALSFALSLGAEGIAELAGDQHALYTNMVYAHGRLMAEAYKEERQKKGGKR